MVPESQISKVIEKMTAVPRHGATADALRFRAIFTLLLLLLIAAPAQVSALEKEIPRRILVLHGWDEKDAEKPMGWPVDTLTGELLQTPLEWLGYEVEYLDLGKTPLPRELDPRFAGIIVDGEIKIPGIREEQVADWLLAAKDRGALLLFAGGFPFARDSVVTKLVAGLGLRGSCEAVANPADVSVETFNDTVLNAETPVKPRKAEYLDLRAPVNAKVFLSLKAQDARGFEKRFDPIFVGPWGGMWLEPYIIVRASADSSLFYADPYRVLEAWLAPKGQFPAPDTSTRDGRRLFYSHIDGDGFASVAEFKGHPLCAELVRDRVLKVFPFPVTVSVIEADIRGLAEGVDKEADAIAKIARDIYALPNVQAASHSFSHPYIWEPRDPNPGIYTEPSLAMKVEPKFPGLDLTREIRGSVDYINKSLLPAGKRCELFLWSGNCRPGPSAIRMVRELGMENLNGGNTIISRMYPGIAGIAPRTMEWDGELQVNASNQNEFMYANGFNGPFYGGFADVIDTFERTETPRRVKPVNAYYHFYSATYLSSMRALEKIYRWAAEQKLHSVTALDFVKLTKDARETRIVELAPKHWRLSNAGELRTFRYPASLGLPDLRASRGVTGWTEHEGQIYVHTQGLKETELALLQNGDKPPVHGHLAESSAEVRWHQFSPGRFDLEATDLRPIGMTFAGLPAGAVCDVTVNGQTEKKAADNAGQLPLTLPGQTRLLLTVPLPPHATR